MYKQSIPPNIEGLTNVYNYYYILIVYMFVLRIELCAEYQKKD